MTSHLTGSELVESLSEPSDPPELAALIVEAGRMKDRLDQLDRILGRDAEFWTEFVDDRAGERVIVVVDKALAEARQLATVFRQTLAEIGRRRGGDSAGRREDDDGAPSWA